MTFVRRWWIGLGLAFGLAAVLAGPSWLVWDALRPRPWDSSTVRIRFDSVRYERAGLVFTYLVENRTWRDARFLPEQTQIKPVQDDDIPPAGYANLQLPLDLPAHSEQRVEIRLEIPSPRLPARPQPVFGEEQLVKKERASDGAGLSMLGLLPPEPPVRSAEESLRDLDGFELVDETGNVRLRFPRGW